MENIEKNWDQIRTNERLEQIKGQRLDNIEVDGRGTVKMWFSNGGIVEIPCWDAHGDVPGFELIEVREQPSKVVDMASRKKD